MDPKGFYPIDISIGCPWSHNCFGCDCSCLNRCKEGQGSWRGRNHDCPIPIIFCLCKKFVKSILALALSLTIVVLIVTIVYYWLLR